MNEELEIVSAVAPQDIGTADVTSSYYSMGGAAQILVTLTTGDLTAAETASVQLLQATSSAGAGAKPLTTASIFEATSGALAANVSQCVVDCDFDTNNGFNHYAVKATCSEAGKLGAATVARGNLRYSN